MSERFSRGNLITIVLLITAVSSLALYFIPLQPVSSGKPKLDYRILTPEHVISGVYKVYGNSRLGFWAAKTIITNVGDGPAYNLKISHRVEGYSDWSDGSLYPVLLPNSTIVDLYYPLLSSGVTKLKAPTPSNVKIKITYAEEPKSELKEISETKPLSILGVHDFVFSGIPPEESAGSFYDLFSNYPLLAAWATPTDPVVMKFADMGNKLAGGAAATESDEEAIKSLSGMWTVSVYSNIQYKHEPEAFWTGKASQYIKFPRDVIKDRAGTCVDTAVFFASLALSQGLNAYVVLMPGHAFPIIQPPSGQMIPVESTTLNARVSFEEAVKAGVETYTEAMSGPYLVVDIQAFQAAGITPPELEELPPDILERWGIRSPAPQTTQPVTTPTTPPTTPMATETYVNPSPKWSLTYPSDWSVTHPSSNVVDFVSPQELEILVVWAPEYDKEQIRELMETVLSQRGYLNAIEVRQGSISGVPATIVLYEWTHEDRLYSAAAGYFDYQGYAYALMYDFVYDVNYERNFEVCESIAATFKLGG
ncbi:MAG: cysteine protease [Candidatus Geothermarchaeales archaeon]